MLLMNKKKFKFFSQKEVDEYIAIICTLKDHYREYQM